MTPFCLPSAAYIKCSQCSMLFMRILSTKGNDEGCRTRKILCLVSKRRGFGTEPTKKEQVSKLVPQEFKGRTRKGPQLTSGIDKKSNNAISDKQFYAKLEAVRRSVSEQKKAEDDKSNLAIDYDAPIESEWSTLGLGTKVGVGVAILVFGLVFAFGDFLPYGSIRPSEDVTTVVEKEITEKDKVTLQTRLKQYEAALTRSPEDPIALEGAAVTLVELGEYERASSLLEKLTKERTDNVDAYRLLGEVKYELKDFEGSAMAYRSSLSASDGIGFEVLRGLTNSLIAAKKPNEAVQVLLSFQEQLNDDKVKVSDVLLESKGRLDKKTMKVDPFKVDLLLGKAFSALGHVSDAVAVYDKLISKYPDDFRGYLAKAIILKESGNIADAERMFIQARFFAPAEGKALVDRYSRK